MRKTKIICTLGPAVDSDEAIRSLIMSGMDCARLNFSHGKHEEQAVRIERVRRISEELGKPVAVLLDTKGPEIRLGLFEDGGVELEAGQEFRLTNDLNVKGNKESVAITYPKLAEVVTVGTRILIDDGLIAMFVERVESPDVVCRVINGGKIKNRKSINIPGARIPMPFLSENDKKDLLFGIEHDVDYIAASFTRSADDVRKLRSFISENGGKNIRIISKIESTGGIENLDEIIRLSDGIMVARGDLGVEIPFKELPGLQKKIIDKCFKTGKLTVTATQMLDSMTHSPRPTRAEVSDVANAIFDGTSAIMLSGETASGQYPIQAIRTMAEIAEQAEKEIDYKKKFMLKQDELELAKSMPVAVALATITSAHYVDAKAIIAVTRTGRSARMISNYRPSVPILAPTVDKKALRQLALSWGVYPVQAKEQSGADSLFQHAEELAMSTGIVEKGDMIVISGGPHRPGSYIDMMRIVEL